MGYTLERLLRKPVIQFDKKFEVANIRGLIANDRLESQVQSFGECLKTLIDEYLGPNTNSSKTALTSFLNFKKEELALVFADESSFRKSLGVIKQHVLIQLNQKTANKNGGSVKKD